MGGGKLLPGPVIRKRIHKNWRPLKKIPEIVREEVERQIQNGRPVRLMFQDEGRFGRINEPRRCWAPIGIRPDVHVQFVREYTYAYVAVSPHDGVMDSLILPVSMQRQCQSFLMR